MYSKSNMNQKEEKKGVNHSRGGDGEDKAKRPSTEIGAKQDPTGTQTTPRREDMEAAATIVIEADENKGAGASITRKGKSKKLSHSRNDNEETKPEQITRKIGASPDSGHVRTKYDDTSACAILGIAERKDEDTKMPSIFDANSYISKMTWKDEDQDLTRLLALKVVDIDPILAAMTLTTMNRGLEKDSRNIDMPACQQDDDYVAAFYIQSPGKVRSIAAYLDSCIAHIPPNPDGGLPLRRLLITKVETQDCCDDLEDIMKDSDGMIVSRGDMGMDVTHSKVSAPARMVSASNQAVRPKGRSFCS